MRVNPLIIGPVVGPLIIGPVVGATTPSSIRIYYIQGAITQLSNPDLISLEADGLIPL